MGKVKGRADELKQEHLLVRDNELTKINIYKTLGFFSDSKKPDLEELEGLFKVYIV